MRLICLSPSDDLTFIAKDVKKSEKRTSPPCHSFLSKTVLNKYKNIKEKARIGVVKKAEVRIYIIVGDLIA